MNYDKAKLLAEHHAATVALAERYRAERNRYYNICVCAVVIGFWFVWRPVASLAVLDALVSSCGGGEAKFSSLLGGFPFGALHISVLLVAIYTYAVQRHRSELTRLTYEYANDVAIELRQVLDLAESERAYRFSDATSTPRRSLIGKAAVGVFRLLLPSLFIVYIGAKIRADLNAIGWDLTLVRALDETSIIFGFNVFFSVALLIFFLQGLIAASWRIAQSRR